MVAGKKRRRLTASAQRKRDAVRAYIKRRRSGAKKQL